MTRGSARSRGGKESMSRRVWVNVWKPVLHASSIFRSLSVTRTLKQVHAYTQTCLHVCPVLTHVQAPERSLVMLSFSFDLGSTAPPPPCMGGVYCRSDSDPYMFHQTEQVFHWTGLSKSLYCGERDRHDGEQKSVVARVFPPKPDGSVLDSQLTCSRYPWARLLTPRLLLDPLDHNLNQVYLLKAAAKVPNTIGFPLYRPLLCDCWRALWEGLRSCTGLACFTSKYKGCYFPSTP